MYQDVKNLVPRGYKEIAGDTYLTCIPDSNHGEYIDMVLHGSTVARFYPTHIQLYSAGWHTTTTKNRLNLALDLAETEYVDAEFPYNGRLGIYQVDYQWYYGNYHKGDTKFYDGMCINYRGEVLKAVMKEG